MSEKSIREQIEEIAVAMRNDPLPAEIRGYEVAGTLADRFWACVDRSGGDEACWLWTRSCRGGSGYGRIWHRGKNVFAHRLVWVLTNGPIPDGLWVLHRCDVPACCNPKHLFLGTSAENTADMTRKQRQAKGESHGNAKLTAADVEAIRADTRRSKLIAAEYGIHFTNVSIIKRRVGWR